MAELLRRFTNPRFDLSPQERTLAWRLHLDLPLLTALLMLSLLGMVVLYSASGEDMGSVVRQGVRLGVGFTALLIIAQLPPRTFHYWAVPLFAAGVVLLILVLFFGSIRNGAQRWLAIPGLGLFQPSEIMKLGLPIMVAWYFSKRSLPPRYTDILIALVIVGIPSALIANQPDLGTAILVGMAGIIVLFFAGISWRIVSSAVIAAMVAAPLMYMFVLEPYQRRRVDTLFNPEADPLGAGWNIIQSKIAIGSGGLFGKGWLNGTQSRLDFLPESSTDFILAVIGEEFGFLGIAILLALYMFIVGRSMFIAWQARETFSRLLGISLGLTFCIYVVVNMGMVSGLLPVVGVPLPLVSYGGTSAVTLLVGFGILMSIHTHRRLLPP
ncbi:rod shape-determining protein RodA [Pseudohongiella sp. SYSU M77423]|uniref:rod shape-determining protein RodA n=1 Tax=Pseudohongiella sp. SYSU M77423 TaxID=3042312 RepID=UPI00247FAFAE|nr:rod shape-determining protein RodA [Pseudohongiella sp. SYSU M77423]MDH7943532.1 rod shape-determining protein RodA [Pseudohongiella sp. SYSU M77423]MEC8859195.1 rod shape-determining protein RodA [Pseudomonadota bacterium]